MPSWSSREYTYELAKSEHLYGGDLFISAYTIARIEITRRQLPPASMVVIRPVAKYSTVQCRSL